jgi:NRAMP (natural resistance-associated macrophage protein)-like metal ion transporter
LALHARRHTRLLAFAVVVGPGVLAGLSDDDPAGITTYSILGADFGYRLLWVLLLSTVALVVFHELGARMGCVTGRGLAGLIRDRYGHRAAVSAAAVLLVANVGTTCAEFAGIAAASELAGVSRYASVPLAAILVSTLVVRGGFKRVEHVLLLLATVFITYFASGVLAHPHWGARAGSSFPLCRCSVTRSSSRPRRWGRRSHPGGWRSFSRTPSTSGSAPATSRSSAWT